MPSRPFLLVFFLASTSFAADGIEEMGELLQVLEPAAGFAVAIGKKDTEGIKQISKTVAMNYVTTKVLKQTMNDISFNGKKIGEGPQHYTHNFPSGHTSTAFAGAWFLHKRYGIKYSAIALPAAAFVGYSTVHSRIHDWDDVFGGTLVGILSAELFTKKFSNTKNTSVGLSYRHRGVGLSFKMVM